MGGVSATHRRGFNVTRRRPRLTFVAKAPVPFHRPILEALRTEVDLAVLYVAEKRSQDYFEDRRPDDLGRTVTSVPMFLGDPERAPRWPLGLGRELDREDPDAVLLHSWDPAMWPAIAWCRRRGVRSVMWTESTQWSGRSRNAVTEIIRRNILRQVDTLVANGTEARRYAIKLGASPSSIETPLYPIDPHRDAANTPVTNDSPPEPSRTGPLRVLFVGRLIPSKRPMDLVTSCDELLRGGVQAELRIVGRGPLEQELEQAALRHHVPIDLRGWREGNRLAEEYEWADVVVVPSEREVWGLIVNEALDHGCFVLASDEVGAAVDLLCDPLLGRVFPVGAGPVLTRLLADSAEMDRSTSTRANRRALAHRLVPGAFSPRHFGQAVVHAAFPGRGHGLQ